MNGEPSGLTVGHVEHRFLAGWRWWTARIAIMLVPMVMAIGAALMGSMLLAIVVFLMGDWLVILWFREDHVLFGHTYHIGGSRDDDRGAQYWVERQGGVSANSGDVFMIVRVAGIFRPTRAIVVHDGGERYPFGRRIMFAGGVFTFERQGSETAKFRHLEAALDQLIEDTDTR